MPLLKTSIHGDLWPLILVGSFIPLRSQKLKRPKRLIGIQSIGQIMQQDYAYVDKTDIIYKLITEGQYYFLSRPRGFAKSLLLSTPQAIFKGDKQLFKNCHIYNTDYDWKKYPRYLF